MTPLIRTETATRRTPVVNYALIIASIFCFMLSSTVPALKTQLLALSSDEPALYQFFTYQFLYANVMHLLVNMFFLWVFGNSVNAKMGNLLYLVFYLTGGAFAGCGFVLGTSGTSWLAGAAGAVTLVTTAYLVLFARSRVTVFRFPTCPPIVLVAVVIGLGGTVTPYGLAGYFFGFAGALVLLFVRAIPRDQFDILAWWNSHPIQALPTTERGDRSSPSREPDTESSARTAQVNVFLESITPQWVARLDNGSGFMFWAILAVFLAQFEGYRPGGLLGLVGTVLYLIGVWRLTTPLTRDGLGVGLDRIRSALRLLAVLGLSIKILLLFLALTGWIWSSALGKPWVFAFIFGLGLLLINAAGALLLLIYLRRLSRWFGLDKAVRLIRGLWRLLRLCVLVLLLLAAIVGLFLILKHGSGWQSPAAFGADWGLSTWVLMLLIGRLPAILIWIWVLVILSRFGKELRPIQQILGHVVCLGCGYLLKGLPEPRCPECGRPFVPVTSAAGSPTGPERSV